MKEVIKGDKKINNMKILRIEDYNYPIVYVENEYSVYKRFVDGKWMYLKRDNC